MLPPGRYATRWSKRLTMPALVAGLAVLTAGCGSSRTAADKAGGSAGPVVLHLAAAYGADQPDAGFVRDFASRVFRMSGGTLRVVARFGVGAGTTDPEHVTARRVESGDDDLGWIGARAWDEFGVTSLQALQAPFLITSSSLLDRVVTGRLGDRMLAGLESQGVVGLALVPGLLRHPVGTARPLVSLRDYEGTHVGDDPSRATDALLRALGAIPVHTRDSATNAALVDGSETSFGVACCGVIVTGNVTFFGKALTLFANRATYTGLTPAQRGLLGDAAVRAAHDTIVARLSESELARRFCVNDGTVALASDQDRAELVRAAAPVYTQLERDPLTRSLITAIRKLKTEVPAEPALVVPVRCRPHDAVTVAGQPRPSSVLNGTYHLVFTRAEAVAFGPPASTDPTAHWPFTSTRIMRDGKFLFDKSLQGTYTIVGNRVTLTIPEFSSVESFAFSFDRGVLRLTPILPMDRGDQFVMAGVPWRRVGPPTGSIP